MNRTTWTISAWFNRFAVLGLGLLLPLTARAITIQPVVVVPTVEYAVSGYDVGPSSVSPENNEPCAVDTSGLAVSFFGPVSELNAAESTVTWRNGWRTADGKFASPLGGGQAGAAAEQSVWDAVSQKPGWNVIEGRVYVRNAAGDLRVYDGAVVSPRGRVIGLEVKSGDAVRTGSQSAFDAGVNTLNPAVGVGENSGLEVGRSLLIPCP